MSLLTGSNASILAVMADTTYGRGRYVIIWHAVKGLWVACPTNQLLLRFAKEIFQAYEEFDAR